MNNQYDEIIERGRSEANDHIIDYLKSRIVAPYLDVGCNTGFLLSEVPGGSGIEQSPKIAQIASGKGFNVTCGDFLSSTFVPWNHEFKTVVLSCVLQQMVDWYVGIIKAMIIADHQVIGVNPYPGRSVWGQANGNKWTKSVIDPDDLYGKFHADIEDIDGIHYFFRITVDSYPETRQNEP